MKSYLPTFAIASALIAMGLATGEFVSSARAQHSQLKGPADMRPEFDSATMFVLRIRMAPHEKTAMHELSARLVIWLTDAHLRVTRSRMAR